MRGQVLLLAPSSGLGGGIERYVETVEWAFRDRGITCNRLSLSRAGPRGHAKLLAEAVDYIRTSTGPVRLVLAHRALLPVASLLTRMRSASGASVVCHGSDVWSSRYKPRWQMEKYLMRRPTTRVVAVSAFTSGALASNQAACILPPGLSKDWFDMLVKSSAAVDPKSSSFQLMTAFRLADWRDKGLPELLEAATALGGPEVNIKVCGSGQPSDDLTRFARGYRCCELMPGLSDAELAREFANADLFVLATRTRAGRRASGEGFGMVLLEAQVAGTAVVGPAYGGSHDAFVDRITGVTPTDESPAALARVLNELLGDRDGLARMGRQASGWARESFSPDRYARLVVDRLL